MSPQCLWPESVRTVGIINYSPRTLIQTGKQWEWQLVWPMTGTLRCQDVAKVIHHLQEVLGQTKQNQKRVWEAEGRGGGKTRKEGEGGWMGRRRGHREWIRETHLKVR